MQELDFTSNFPPEWICSRLPDTKRNKIKEIGQMLIISPGYLVQAHFVKDNCFLLISIKHRPATCPNSRMLKTNTEVIKDCK